jgi:fatty acid desaturase
MTKETLQKIQALRDDKRNLPVALHVGSTFAILALALVAMKVWPHPAVWVAAFVVIGFMQYRLVMAIHEATHKNLFFPAAVNEAFGKGLSGLLGMNFLLYRKSHLQHHKTPQKIGEDVDAPLYSPPLRVKPGLPRFFALLTGVVVSLFRKVVRKFTTRAQFGSKTIETERDWVQLALIGIGQAAVFALFATQFHWWAYFTHWLAPLVLIAQLLDEVRIFVEHGYWFFQTADPAPMEDLEQATVDIEATFLESYLIAPFGFDTHLAHHTQFGVPFYNLRKLSKLLQEHEPGYLQPIRRSYLAVLWDMINAEPKVPHPA